MPRILCHYLDCVFLDGKYCSAAAIELDPDIGCKTYKPDQDIEIEDWDDSEDIDDWDEIEDDEDEDIWLDADDDLLDLELDDEDDF
ncbi:MAG: hypothetical protein SVP52_08470 [Chloroflexota bacterium]|nr:hypothetical protein [Chloroflexota bacterium]